MAGNPSFVVILQKLWNMPISLFDETFLSLRQIVNPFILLFILLAAGIILSNKVRKTLQGRLLLIILLVFWLMSFNSMLMSFGLRQVFIWSLFTYFPLPLFIAPLCYFYIRSLVTESYRVSIHELLHLTIPLIFFILSFIVNMVLAFAGLYQNVELSEKAMTLFIGIQDISLFYVLLIQIVCYSWLCIRLLVRHKRNVEHFFSFSEGISLHWVRFFVVGMILYFAVFMLSNNELLFIPGISDSIYDISNFSITLFFIFMIGTHGSVQHNVYETSKAPAPLVEETTVERTAVSIDENRKNELSQRIRLLLESEKLYLNPSLTLDLLASSIESNRTYTSFVINECFGMSFYSLINKYRVEEAIRMLQDGKHNNYSVEGIAGMCGFTSRSSFNSAFRKHTGKTPSDFRMVK